MKMSDSELVARALSYWANHIETGSMVLSANDLAERNRCLPVREQKAPPVLCAEQLQLVDRLRQLSREHAGGGRAAPRL